MQAVSPPQGFDAVAGEGFEQGRRREDVGVTDAPGLLGLAGPAVPLLLLGHGGGVKVGQGVQSAKQPPYHMPQSLT